MYIYIYIIQCKHCSNAPNADFVHPSKSVHAVCWETRTKELGQI